jgi:hypothetical protein
MTAVRNGFRRAIPVLSITGSFEIPGVHVYWKLKAVGCPMPPTLGGDLAVVA